MKKHDELRNILIENNCPEVGDAIIDSICKVFGYPDTNTDDTVNEIEGKL